MKEVEETSLMGKYSHLFSKLFYGFEVPSGWDWIVEKYLEKTQWDVEKNNLNITILQIKEKFGELRIYTDVISVDDGYYSPLDEENIAYCVALADHTCEKCGCITREKQYTKGWITGLCPTCFKERGNEAK
jgi:hypothetical protein